MLMHDMTSIKFATYAWYPIRNKVKR